MILLIALGTWSLGAFAFYLTRLDWLWAQHLDLDQFRTGFSRKLETTGRWLNRLYTGGQRLNRLWTWVHGLDVPVTLWAFTLVILVALVPLTGFATLVTLAPWGGLTALVTLVILAPWGGLTALVTLVTLAT